jgi:hypothetical protein
MGEGYFKCIALEGKTDIFDIITSLIMYGIESGKIKKLLSEDETLLKEIEMLRGRNDSREKNQALCRIASRFSAQFQELKDLDAFLRSGLFDLITNIVQNDLDKLEIEFASEFAETNYSSKARHWRRNLENVGRLHKSRPVIIISSDLHNVVGCLTDFAQVNRARIEKLAESHEDVAELDIAQPGNLQYVLYRLCLTDPDLYREKVRYEEGLGIRYIPDIHNTGIDVQLVDAFGLDPAKVDPRIKIHDWTAVRERAPYIINIHYAFGLQATEIMRELIEAFSTRIESISIIGKAGIVCGDRFDILLPTYLVPQEIETGVHDFPNGNRLTAADFEGLTPSRIHTGGPMLTVPGIAIQNDVVLKYLIRKYNIQGLEMEGVPYLRAIRRAEKMGLLSEKLFFCVGYWGSDNPLQPHQLIARSHMGEGAVSANALTAAVLTKTLNKGMSRAGEESLFQSAAGDKNGEKDTDAAGLDQ